MKVKCIDATGDAGGLNLNQLYEVVQEIAGFFSLSGIKGIWRKSRFVEESESATVRKHMEVCACGITRQDCTYHKEP